MNEKCHACGAGDSYNQFYWHNSRHIKDTYQCGVCAHIFRRYDGDVEEYHREKYRAQGEEGHNMYSEEERLKYISTILQSTKHFITLDMTALEIGSGDGLFATQAKEYVKSIVCSDIDSKMSKKCEELGFDVLTCSALDLDEDKNYDVIFGFDVLEHVLNVQRFKDKMSKIVNKYLVLQVPVNRTMVPPNDRFDGHSHYFSSNSITKLFESFFTPEGIYYGDRGQLARGPELLCVLKKKEQ